MENQQRSELLIWCKESTGENLQKGIVSALESDIYDFTELVNLPSIASLPENDIYRRTLEFFAFSNLTNEQKDLLKLTPKMKEKLQQVTVIDLAKKNKKLLLSDLKTVLKIEDNLELHRLLLTLLENKAVQGKIDEKNAILKINQVNTRFFGNSDEEVESCLL